MFPIVSFTADQWKRVVVKTENVTSRSIFSPEGRLFLWYQLERKILNKIASHFRQICVLGINIFHRDESFKEAFTRGRPLRHGQHSDEKRRPRKWYNKFSGGICCYTQPSEKTLMFCFRFLSLSKSFPDRGQRGVQSKMGPSFSGEQFLLYSVNYTVTSSFGFN